MPHTIDHVLRPVSRRRFLRPAGVGDDRRRGLRGRAAVAALIPSWAGLLAPACARPAWDPPVEQPAAAPSAIAADEPGRLTLSTERVVVFKDGYALFVKAATGVADDMGRVFTTEVPGAAVLGSFWAWAGSADPSAPLAMRAEWVEREERSVSRTACSTMGELLRANTGRAVTLEVVGRDRTEVRGVIASVLGREGEQEQPAVAGRGELSSRRFEMVPQADAFVVIDEEGSSRLVIPVANVVAIRGAELETLRDRPERVVTRSKRLVFELGPAAAGRAASVRLMYFTPGLRWIPTYRLGDLTPDSGVLALQGELVNEAESFTDAAVDLVVGVPNFRYRETISPLALEAVLVNALENAVPGLMGRGGQMAQVQFLNRADERTSAGFDPAAPTAPADIAAAGEQDLYVYSLGSMSLARGERAASPLWRRPVELAHVYTMDVGIVRRSRGADQYVAGGPGGGRPDQPVRRAGWAVWHQLELHNTTGSPLTTGACLLTQGLLPLGQDLLGYTPIGGRSLLPVTVAVDVAGSYREDELSREPNALNWGGNMVGRVTKQARVGLTNRRPEAVTVRVTLATGGRVKSASDDASVQIGDARPDDWGDGGWWWPANNHSEATWEVTIAPGESRELTAEVEYYVD